MDRVLMMRYNIEYCVACDSEDQIPEGELLCYSCKTKEFKVKSASDSRVNSKVDKSIGSIFKRLKTIYKNK